MYRRSHVVSVARNVSYGAETSSPAVGFQARFFFAQHPSLPFRCYARPARNVNQKIRRARMIARLEVADVKNGVVALRNRELSRRPRTGAFFFLFLSLFFFFSSGENAERVNDCRDARTDEISRTECARRVSEFTDSYNDKRSNFR